MIDRVPPPLARILDRELAPGERIIWQARPAPSNRMRACLGNFLFGIPLFAFAVIWTLGASGGFASERSSSRSWPPWFPVLWGGMFILLSACMLLSPLWAWWVARHTVYAITDRRAILIEAPFRRTIQSFTGERLTTVVRTEDSRGRGDLVFEREASKGSKGRTVYRDIGFFGLTDAKAVEQILQTTYANTRNA